jgi:hypothetical protein
MAIKFLSNETIDGTLVITGGITASGITANGANVTNTFKSTVLINRVGQQSTLLIGSNSIDDVVIGFQTDGNSMSMGIDRSDSNAFKISDSNGGVGTLDRSKIDTTGASFFTGLVSGITPTAAANFVTKEYIDGGGGAGSGFLPLTGGTLTGDLTIDNSSPEFYLTPDSAKYSWMIAAQENVDQHFEITPSTTVGGTTFNAPALKINGANSDATFAGNVLIGTNISSSIGLQVNHSLASGAAIAFFRNSSSSGGNGIVVDVTNTPNTYIADFRIGNVSKVRIDTLGSVGIGTTSPTQKLNVVNDNTGTWTAKFTNNTNNVYLSVNDANNYGIYVTGETKNYFSGNVGIGTTSPSTKLHIGSGAVPSTTLAGVLLTNGAAGYYQCSDGTKTIFMGIDSSSFGIIGTLTNHDLAFRANNDEKMRITSAGQINMGTSTAYHQFEPEADLDFNLVMNAGQAAGNPNFTIKSSTSGAAITSRLLLIGSTGNMTITGSLTQNGSISDISLKENIKPVENALDKIEKLNAVTFDWKKSDSILQLKEDYGFIAQEVEKVIPEIVRTNDDDKKAINYNGITSVLVKAIQELKAEIELLKKK